MATGTRPDLGMLRFGTSDRLMAVFRTCSRDPTEPIKARLRRMLHTFLQHHQDNERTHESAAKCCREAGIWYFRILESHSSRERERLGIRDISAIFENDLLQSCLVACCLEIAISSNDLPCDFPELLQILHLAPYHFWKVIELVLRDWTYLSSAVVRHLAKVEEKVLEDLAWTRDSPLWEDIRANEGHLPTCQQVMPSTRLEDPMKTDLQADVNQPGAGLGLGAVPSDQQRSSPAVNRPRRSNPLYLFTRKVYSLMGRRLRELCSTLGISNELRLKIWTCFEHSLVHCSDLMVDRHLDQLLMCAIYIIAKITMVEMPFKHIMKCYTSQPLTTRDVCRNVLISVRDSENSLNGNNNDVEGILTPNSPSAHHPGPGQVERGNLIHFYNKIYTTRMSHFAELFSPSHGGETPPLSPYPRQGEASPRRRRLSSRYPIFISPSNTDTTRPPAPALRYYFNSSPPEILREINNMIRTGWSPNRRRHVASQEEEEEEGEGENGPPARRRRLDDLSAWQRRLRSVADARVTRRDPGPVPPAARPDQH